MAAAGRPAAGSEGEAAVRIRGVDAEGIRLGLPEVHLRIRCQDYEAILAKPFENRFLLEKMPDFYDG